MEILSAHELFYKSVIDISKIVHHRYLIIIQESFYGIGTYETGSPCYENIQILRKYFIHAIGG
jgi:hypothetical protein